MNLNVIYQGDALKVLEGLPEQSVNCCITSPPYFGLRDYGTATWIGGDENCSHRRNTKNNNPDWAIQSRGKIDNGVGDEIFREKCKKCGAERIDDQIGLEETPSLYIESLVNVFREVKRVLKNDGTLWVNIGDSYAAYFGSKYGQAQSLSGKRENIGDAPPSKKSPDFKALNLKPKDLIGIPWMLAFALRADGWYLRQDIIWNKPNPMPESVSDRCTKAHEYVFLLSKSSRYNYDADSIRTESKNAADDLRRLNQQSLDNKNTPDNLRNGLRPRKVKIPGGWDRGEGGHGTIHRSGRTSAEYQEVDIKAGANKRSVWTVPTMPFSDSHFATFPEDLISDMIKAGCLIGGVVLDPFFGAGTTGLVAKKLNRNFIGIELNPDYIKIAEQRLFKELGLFNEVDHTI